MQVLVTGGAGYIGGHVAQMLSELGHGVVVIDNLSTGFFSRIGQDVKFYDCDIRTLSAVESVFQENQIEAVIHLAGLKSVIESFDRAEEYDEVNNRAALSLMEIAKRNECNTFIFSSTAAVYGNGTGKKAKESDLLTPISPYGTSKKLAEQNLDKLAKSLGIRYTALRYFNVAGCKSSNLRDENLSNLIPIVIDNLKNDTSPKIFGGDYDTPDGTCVRDYVHVSDIATAHLKCLDLMHTLDFPRSINIGTSKGHSVLDVVNTAKRVLEKTLEPIVCERRPGDPSELLADNGLMMNMLKFTPSLGLEDIIRSLSA